MIWESIKTVFKELRLNKLRTFLTMLGIIVGIFSITIIFALSNATKKTMNNTISEIATELITFNVLYQTNIEKNFVENDLKNYAKSSNKIDKMSKSLLFTYDEYDQILKNKNSFLYDLDGQYYAIDENYFELNFPNLSEDDLVQGRFLTKKDIINKMPYVMLREDVAKDLLGKTNVVGKKININNNEFEIIGILKYEENELSMQEPGHIYISYYYAKEYMKVYPSTTYYFSPTNNEYTKDIKKEVKDILNQYLSAENYTCFSLDLDMLMSNVESMVNIVELVFVGIASLSIVVGGVGIMNIMLVSVSERIKETGIRMALGAKNSDIVFQFLIEGIMLTLFSGLIGIIFAWLATLGVNFAISKYTSYKFILEIDMITMIKIIIFCGLIGIVFGIYPAIKAGKLDPVEALKYE